ncbi:MAG TPA: hypothetical protein PLQ89_12880 [Phycisphaerae bacterium]|nr:hypothetical protein [Phycisphaerae bacterium]
MATRERAKVNDRDIHIVTGDVSQTVNICTPENKLGRYDWVVRLSIGQKVTPDIVRGQPDIESLVTWLEREHFGQIEQRPTDEGAKESLAADEQPPKAVPTDPDDALWIQRAMSITEICIDELVREFLELPYLHRVEHSIHARLYGILRAQPHFDRHYPLAGGMMMTQLIHKEWPETQARPDKDNRRGNFDLVILSPGRLKRCSAREFDEGRIVPPIVIEMGLNYGQGHLVADAEKLLNSHVQHGYLVHLVRDKRHDPTIDEAIRSLQERSCSIKVAFARYQGGRKYQKLLEDKAICEVLSTRSERP